jgi:hypothetical protein
MSSGGLVWYVFKWWWDNQNPAAAYAPIDWYEFLEQAGMTLWPIMLAYWIKHRHLLKVPKPFQIPIDFQAAGKSTDSGV